jgi:hypothetical protein
LKLVDAGPPATPADAATPVKPADAALPMTSADAAPATDAAEPNTRIELPLELTNVDVAQNIKRRFGAPHVAINRKDPNNIVVLASSNHGYTKDCVPAPAGSDCEMIPAGGNPF